MASKSQSPRTRKAPVTRSSPTMRTKTVLRESGTARGGSTGTGTASQKRGEADSARSARQSADGGEAEVSPVRFIPTWLQWTTFVLALAGLGVSAYLTYAHYTEAALLGCAESGTVNCQKVTTSAQSYVFGIPVAVLGLAFYAFAVPVMSPWAWRLTWLGNSTIARWVSDNLGVIRLASIFVGVGFVLYLLYAELFMIDAICLYCTSVHVITFILFALVVFAAAAWGLRPSTTETAD